MKAILPTNRDRPLFLTDFTIVPESHRESINYFHWVVMLRAIRLSLCVSSYIYKDNHRNRKSAIYRHCDSKDVIEDGH